jgi:23S rRNA (guanosine2251-2'-O)-methyltransferase
MNKFSKKIKDNKIKREHNLDSRKQRIGNHKIDNLKIKNNKHKIQINDIQVNDVSVKEDFDSYIYGKNAILESINSENISSKNIINENINSEKEIQKIFVCFGSDNAKIVTIARKQKIKISTLDKKKFKELETKVCPTNAKTQGVIALKQIIATVDLEDFISTLNMRKNPIIVILDGINDPQNLGAIARSAECAGVSALILPQNNSTPITPTALKTSAGALNYLPVIQISNLIKAIETLKRSGFWIMGTALQGNENYDAKIYNKPSVIIIGSEGKGISPSIIKHCDHLIKINMFGRINSLNASVTAGIIFFEIQRQNQE